MEYSYTEQNGWDTPQHYQFSKYNGPGFIRRYRLSRTEIMEKILNEVKIRDTNRPIISFFYNNKNASKTSKAIQIILVKIKNKENIAKNYSILSRYVKKYEITKRVYSEYDEKLKPIGTACRNPLDYLALSMACLTFFEITKNLKFMNTALKLNDLLCSVLNELTENTERLMLHACLEKELKLINEINKKRGKLK